MLIAVLDNKFVVSFIIIFGTLSFLIAGCRLGVDGPRDHGRLSTLSVITGRIVQNYTPAVMNTRPECGKRTQVYDD